MIKSYLRQGVATVIVSFTVLSVVCAQDLKYHIEEAPEWTQLFYRTDGWFGADGIFSIGLDGNDKNGGDEKTLIIFSDSFIGKVTDGAPEPGYTMVNNTIAYFDGTEAAEENLTIHVNRDDSGVPMSFFIPDNPNSKEGQHFWLGDGFINKEQNDRLYIFGYHVEWTGENVFDFKEPNVSLLSIPDAETPPFSDYQQLVTPLHVKHGKYGEGNFGSGIYVNTEWAGAPDPDGYVYVYGCIGKDKNLMVARVEPKWFDDFGKWTYWNGETWDENIKNIKSVTNAVSNELSLTPLDDGRYLLVFQVLGLSDKVGIRIGESPIGPFGEITEIYTTPEFEQGVWTYNAKAHPALSKPGELLISYNTITLDFWNDIEKDAHIYRPRFIKMVFDSK